MLDMQEKFAMAAKNRSGVYSSDNITIYLNYK